MPSIGNHITILQCVDSSNNYAMAQVHAGMAVHGQGWLAVEQTAGKGQRGKKWQAAAGENLLLSVALETGNLAVYEQFKLSAAISLAVCAFFSSLAGGQAKIKWPNDLYWGDRKAGGVLIENIIGGNASEIQPVTPFDIEKATVNSGWKWAIVGIGININQSSFSPELKNPVSLSQVTGCRYEMPELVPGLCAFIDQYWQQLLAKDWPGLLAEYNQLLYKRGDAVRLRKQNVVMPCTIRGVSTEGMLLIEEDEDVAFRFGEISWEI